MMNAVEYISRLQRDCGLASLERTLGTEEYQGEWLRLIELGAPADLVRNDISTFLDSITQSAEEYSKTLVEAVRTMNLNLPVVPVIGILPIGDFNAWASTAPDGSPICILEMTLGKTCFILGNCVAESTIPSRDPAVKPDFHECILTAIYACEEFACPGKRRSRAADYLRGRDQKKYGPWYLFGAILGRAMELFGLAHEFAHHIKGHVSRTVPMVLSYAPEPVRIDVLSRSQADEFEADELAMDIFLRTQERERIKGAHCAPLILLRFMAFTEQYILKLDDSEFVHSTHPPADQRLQRLADRTTQRMDADALDYWDRSLGVFWRNLCRIAQGFVDEGLL